MYGYSYIPLYNTYSSGVVPPSYLVDDYSPVEAFSMRKISSTATNAVRVRRDSDNAEQDIGFVGNDLDTASLSSFVGANSAYVVTWYNQGTGGSSYDMTQTTAANQPRIVNAGTIKTTNSVTSIEFLYLNDWYLQNAIAETTENNEVICVFEKTQGLAVTSVFSFYGGAANKYRQIGNGITASNIGATVRNTSAYGAETPGANNTQFLLGAYYKITDRSIYVNNAYITQNTTSSADFTTTGHYIGKTTAAGNSSSMNIQEVVRFTSVQTSDRTDINTNINSYYGIY